MARRGAAFVVLLALLLVGVLLSVLPAGAGAIRIAGVGLTWWYAIVIAPVAATVVALVAGPPANVRSLAPWATPALVVSLAMQVFAAVPAAPLVALAAVFAPLLARLVRAPATGALPPPLAAGLLTAVVALLVWANFLVVADASRGLGGERWHGLALTVPAALALAWWPGARWRRPALIASVALLTIALVAVAAAVGVSPWRAWSRLASRPMVAFTERSFWVREGRSLPTPTSVTLTEPQRMTAMTAAVWRVVADDGNGAVMREWRLKPGDSLALRSGDQVLLPAGAGVLFEPGHRVPGAPLSGPAWADAEQNALGGLLVAAGAALTLVGGGLVLLTPSRGATVAYRFASPAIAFVVVLVAVCWGVYAADVGADLTLGMTAEAAFVRLPSAAVPGALGSALAVVVGLAIVGLLVTAVTTLADGVAGTWCADRRSTWLRHALRATVVIGGAALALAPVPPWNVLMLGFALAAAGLGPALVDAPPRARLIASMAGSAGVVALALAGAWLAPTAPTLALYPALVAVPMAAAAGWVAAGRRG